MADEKQEATEAKDTEDTKATVETSEAEEGAEGKKSKKKLPMMKILIIAGVAVVFLGAGAGAMFFFMKPEPPVVTAETTEGEKPAEAKPEPEPVVDLPEEAIYFEFHQPFTITFDRNQKNVRYLQVSVAVLTRHPETRQLLKDHEYLIMNEVEMLLGEKTFPQLDNLAGKEKLREELKETIEASLKSLDKEATVERILYTKFVMN